MLQVPAGRPDHKRYDSPLGDFKTWSFSYRPGPKVHLSESRVICLFLQILVQSRFFLFSPFRDAQLPRRGIGEDALNPREFAVSLGKLRSESGLVFVSETNSYTARRAWKPAQNTGFPRHSHSEGFFGGPI